MPSNSPSNEERRATAKQKLDQQVEQRARDARRRRLLAIAAAAGAALLVIGAGTTMVFKRNSATDSAASSDSPVAVEGELPPFVAAADLGSHCEYPSSAQPASRKVDKPRSGTVPTEPAQVSVSMATDQGKIGLLLANDRSPCTVNSFVSLAAKEFFNNTQCHRLTTSPMLSVLQCGDPAGDGRGGPGYQFANEYPTDQYALGDTGLQTPVRYPRGTLAMANAGPGTNGSQFFLVYQDSQLPPLYTVFGTVQEDGLETLDKIAAAGVKGGGTDGSPATKVTIKSVLVD